MNINTHRRRWSQQSIRGRSHPRFHSLCAHLPSLSASHLCSTRSREREVRTQSKGTYTQRTKGLLDRLGRLSLLTISVTNSVPTAPRGNLYLEAEKGSSATDDDREVVRGQSILTADLRGIVPALSHYPPPKRGPSFARDGTPPASRS